jgi:GTPase SAR1 family protein
MTFNKFLIVFTAFTLFLTACGGDNPTPNTNTTANANTVAPTNTNSAAPNSNSPIATTTATPAQTTNNAETIKPVVLAYYEALKTKNDAALKKVYSQATLASLEKDAKEEGKKSLVEFITELEPVPDQPFEVRNEQINGDIAIAEMRGGAYPNGIKIKFVKENGEWKMTNESPEFQKK